MGNSAAAHRRLRKDRPDLHKRVLAGEISANAAWSRPWHASRAPGRRLKKLFGISGAASALNRGGKFNRPLQAACSPVR
jgi:hypothetical protein